MPVQHVVLEHEDDVEDDGHDSQHPLDNVEATAAEGRLAFPHGQDDVLQDGEGAACEIQHDVRYRPAHRRLALVVQVDLKV